MYLENKMISFKSNNNNNNNNNISSLICNSNFDTSIISITTRYDNATSFIISTVDRCLKLTKTTTTIIIIITTTTTTTTN